MIALIYQKTENIGQYHAVVNQEWILKFDNNKAKIVLAFFNFNISYTNC